MYRIIKLDGRYTGNQYFNYCINVDNYHGSVAQRRWDLKNYFCELRNWSWFTWGPSKELYDWLDDTRRLEKNIVFNPISLNDSWCWSVEHGSNSRIYLRTDKELVVFKLRWG